MAKRIRIDLIIIVIACLMMCWLYMVPYIKMQDPGLMELKNFKFNGLMTARKANVPFLTGADFILIPGNVKSEDFIQWCKEKNVRFILWSWVEAQSRPLLTDQKWAMSLRVVWSRNGWGFIAEIPGAE